jgi:ATP-binding cassette subfamily C protein
VAGTLPPSFSREIMLDRITFAYDERPVLRDASLRIAKGDFLTLVGSSGSGKTTTIDLLIGFYQPQAGRILIDGVDLRELNLSAWRRFVGYVPQDAFLFHDTVRRNITLGDPTITDEQVWRVLSLAGAHEFVNGIAGGLDAVLGERGSRISGGERQRIGLARALVYAPPLLILDEVSSALDLDTERAICHTLSALPGTVTIVAVSHRPGFLEAASRVVRLQDGGFMELPATETVRLLETSPAVPAA